MSTEFIKKIDDYIQNEEKMMSEQITEQFVPNNSQELQEESLVCFMEALGYEPVYKFNGKYGDFNERLTSFRSDKYVGDGLQRLSVNTAIKMHNLDPDYVISQIRTCINPNGENFKNWINHRFNYIQVAILFAGTCKIVETVKGCGSKKKGLIIHDHTVKFMSKQAKKNYGNFIGL